MARLDVLHLEGSRLSFMSSRAAVVVFTVLALFEIVNDKLPKTPPRTAPPGFIARIVTSAWCGAALAIAGGAALTGGIVAGMIGAVVGTYGGYFARRGAAKATRAPDYVVALAEDLIAIAGGAFIVSRR
jgi:uncharacterized membrane protein